MGGAHMKTIRFKRENFDLLLQGPSVKSTTIRAGDKTERFRVGERVEARTKDRAVECEVTMLFTRALWDLTNLDAKRDGFQTQEELVAALRRINRGIPDAALVTIIGLRVAGKVRDTRFEVFSDEDLRALLGQAHALLALELQSKMERELERRKEEAP